MICRIADAICITALQHIADNWSSYFHASPKGYEIPYRICYEDIEQLNLKITQLYEQYNIQSSNCSVTVYHEKDQKQVFSSFERFKLYDKSLLSPTESILLKYNFLIVLPKLNRPQSYTVSVRIGSKVTILKKLEGDNLPSMIIKMVSGRSAQVTVGYVDYTVARNFLDTIDAWFKSVDASKYSAFFKAIKNNTHLIPSIAKYSVGLFSGYLCLKYSPQFINNASTGYLEFYSIALKSFAFILLTCSLAGYFGRSAERNLDFMTELSYLKLNRGDEKEVEKFIAKNRRGLIKAVLGLFGSFGIGVVSSIVATMLMT